MPARQPKRRRLWLNGGSCVRLRPERADSVWAYDFVEDPAAIPPGFGELIARDTPGFVRSDNGPGFIAMAVKGWVGGVGARTTFIEPGSPWENGYVESFNGKLRDGLRMPRCSTRGSRRAC